MNLGLQKRSLNKAAKAVSAVQFHEIFRYVFGVIR
jgi:hypothetical protein